MEQQVITNRKIQVNNSFIIIQQRCCQTLLFKLMKYQAVLYAVLTVFSIPFLIMSSMEFLKYQSNYIGTPSILDYALVVTNAHQHHCDRQSLCTFYLAQQSNYECILAKQKNGSLAHLSASGASATSIKPNIYSNSSEIDKQNKNDQNSKGNNVSIITKQNNTNTTDKENDDQTSVRNPCHTSILNYSHPYFRFSLIYDSILQFLLCIGCAIIQYKSFKAKEEQKGKFIQNYSLQLRNLPIKEPYIMLPVLQAYIIQQIKNSFHVITQNQREPQIFSTTSAIAQQEFNQFTLNNEIKLRVSQGIEYTNLQKNDKSKVLDEVQKKIQKINDKLIKFSHSSAASDTVWITFQTRKARYLALRTIQYAKQKFMGHWIKVRSAPHPLQIIWQNLHISLSKIIISRVIVITICMIILLAIDLLILYIQKTTSLIVASISVNIIEIILKQIIVTISKFGKYQLKSKQDLSIFCNLIKFLYINTALITFMSSYDFGDFQLVHFFSTSMYQGIGYKWFQNVGKSILLNFLIQMVYVCVRPFIQVLKMIIFTRIQNMIDIIKKRFYKKDMDLIMYGQKKQIQQKHKLKSELDICYAYLICVLMFGNTYTFTHPIIYFLLTVFFIVVSISHKKYIVKYAEPAPYNTNLLNRKAIQYMYYSVVLHWIFIYITYKFIFALILAVALAIILIFKNTLIEIILEKLRAKIGPFSSSQFNRMSSQTIHLSELLTLEQIQQQIQTLHSKIIQYTYLYAEKNSNGDAEKSQELAKYIAKLEQKIAKLEKNKQLLSLEEKTSRLEGIGGYDRKIKGALSYSFTQKLYNL